MYSTFTLTRDSKTDVVALFGDRSRVPVLKLVCFNIHARSYKIMIDTEPAITILNISTCTCTFVHVHVYMYKALKNCTMYIYRYSLLKVLFNSL